MSIYSLPTTPGTLCACGRGLSTLAANDGWDAADHCEACEAFSSFSDLHKDAYGVRPHPLTVVEADAMVASYVARGRTF